MDLAFHKILLYKKNVTKIERNPFISRKYYGDNQSLIPLLIWILLYTLNELLYILMILLWLLSYNIFISLNTTNR
jgi:hypothetical protein